MDPSKLSVSERVELGLDLAKKMDRVQDHELRVLIFTACYFVLDGVTLTIRRLEGHLRSRGATVKILSTVAENCTEDLSNVIVVPSIKIPFNHAGDYAFGSGLDEGTIRQIEAFKPNLVHFTVPDFVALDGIKWCQRNNVAYIGTWHSNYTDYLKYYFLEWVLGPGFHVYLKGFFEQMPTVYVPTNYMLRKMREEWGYGKATELKLWGRGVDMNMFSPERRSQRFRSSKGISESDVVVLWVGRLVPEKRPDIWLGVVKRLQDEGLPVKAMIVGAGTFERNFAQLRDATCLGWLSGNALGEAYASADILLFPSDVETFGNVTLEALSAGCPAIVEKKCGEHLVDHTVNGMTCQVGDAEGFYQATRRLVTDHALRKSMGIAAREKAKRFERSFVLQQMAENYKDAIDKHRDPAFIMKHMENPLGAGRNILSVCCCDYYLIKKIAEPFLSASRSVQDGAECANECMTTSRSRLSCANLLVAANMPSQSSALNITELDIERGQHEAEENEAAKYGEDRRSVRRYMAWFRSCVAQYMPAWCAEYSAPACCGGSGAALPSRSYNNWWKFIQQIGFILMVMGVLLIVYYSFTV